MPSFTYKIQHHQNTAYRILLWTTTPSLPYQLTPWHRATSNPLPYTTSQPTTQHARLLCCVSRVVSQSTPPHDRRTVLLSVTQTAS
ncbi:hypothetical protein E2C01_081347 [Portunus trituberculatus]|uniref:Uncharacterized protein n=1 Tax=Portunus trituberculatus TaxID=210409 RepID=A0A5B7IYJ6_PORTR|nr:hypothetical protein [Portunus trituberculatus]